MIGEGEVERLFQTAHANARVSNPLTAAKAALDVLGVRRPAFVSPYMPEVSAAMREALESCGMEIAGFGSFEENDERVVARITPESCLDAIVSTARAGGECDGVFIACTDLRALGVIEQAEEILGVPVVSSNQALAWHLLRLAGVPDAREGLWRFVWKKRDDGGVNGEWRREAPLRIFRENCPQPLPNKRQQRLNHRHSGIRRAAKV